VAFKIALTAGHYMGTPGKRCLKKLDPNQTREWWLNDRIADKVEKLLQEYTGWELLRTDDTTGKKDVSLSKRTKAANNFKADFYLSIHHNAGVKGGSGGGIVAYVYTKAQAESIEWQKALYKALIDATWLKGNRSNPMPKKNLHEVRETTMPAVLLELGFMDSSTDVPIILTEEYADRCAEAIVKVLAERGNLQLKTPAPEETPGTDDPEAAECCVTLPVLKKGDKQEAVVSMQRLLIAAGYSCGPKADDGRYGPATDEAVQQFQVDNDLPLTQSCDAATWEKLLGVK
jgi:N-acetylmuramoyl-L-alanine amidase